MRHTISVLVENKFGVLARMLAVLWTQTADRIVIVSNYTQTLDLVSTLCREKGYPYVRLDGTTTMKKRQKMVKEFNDAVFNGPVGVIQGPVKTQFGYHLILVTDRVEPEKK